MNKFVIEFVNRRTKQARQFVIKELIAEKAIGGQEELRRELRKRGFAVTQATLSRDLQDLGVSRLSFGDGAKYVLQPTAEANVLKPVVWREVLTITASESVIAVRTLPGCASSVGEFLDMLNNPDIIGTVAGDNTLLVVPRSQKKTRHVVKFLREKLVEGK